MKKSVWILLVVGILIISTVGIIIIVVNECSRRAVAMKAAEEIISTWEYIGELPVGYNLRAILYCDGNRYLVRYNPKVTMLLLDCKYQMAPDMEIKLKYEFLFGNVIARFIEE